MPPCAFWSLTSTQTDMFMLIDVGGVHALNTTFHPINIHTGAMQDHTAYLANGQNVTKSSGKVVINQIMSFVAPGATTFTYQIKSINDATVILQGSFGGNVASNRNSVASPIEIDQPVSIRFTAGAGLVYIDYDIAEI